MDEYIARCPLCNEWIDYCLGHGTDEQVRWVCDRLSVPLSVYGRAVRSALKTFFPEEITTEIVEEMKAVQR